jgi:hypothetical protein
VTDVGYIGSGTVLTEPLVVAGGWTPPKAWAVNRFGLEPQLVLEGGQFYKNLNDDLGTERLYSHMDLRVYYSNSDDYLPPTINQVRVFPFANQLIFRVDTEDDSGINTVIVNYRPVGQVRGRPGIGQWLSFELKDFNNDGVWEGNLPTSQPTAYFVQAVDEAGNVQMSGNKGAFFAGDDDPAEFVSDVYLPVVIR